MALRQGAVHRTKPISPAVSVLVADELFQVFRWLALTYGRDATSIRGFSFDKALLPQPQSSPREPAMSLEQLQELANQLAERDSSPAPCQCGHQPTRSGSHRTTYQARRFVLILSHRWLIDRPRDL